MGRHFDVGRKQQRRADAEREVSGANKWECLWAELEAAFTRDDSKSLGGIGTSGWERSKKLPEVWAEMSDLMSFPPYNKM